MNNTAQHGTSAGSADFEDQIEPGFDPAVVVPARYVSDVLCPGLPKQIAREVGRQTRYVVIDDLVALGLITPSAAKIDENALNSWCQRTLRGPFDPYAKVLEFDEMRALVAGQSPGRRIALATLNGLDKAEKPWAAAAVKEIRDANTVARAGARRAELILDLPVSRLLALGASSADVRVLVAADSAGRASSVKIIEAWAEEDRLAARNPVRPVARLSLTRASAVTREHIDWLWTTEEIDPMVCGVAAALIPLHGLTLIAGREGAAKSLFSLWLAAQVTRGGLPGHYEGRPRDVVILATEDTASTIRMRLEAAGADLERVHLPRLCDDEGIELPIAVRDNIEALTDMLAELEPGLVILDPLKDFLGDDVNTDREHEVRPALTPLLKLSEECNAPIVGLHHLNKSKTGDFLTRLTGSGAFKNVARSILGVAHDEENDTRVLQQKKANLAAAQRGAFRAQVQSVDISVDGRVESVGRWVMDGASQNGIDAVLSAKEQGGAGPSQRDRAVEFLRECLGGGPQPSRDVRTEAAERGISEPTLKRAFSDLGGISERTKEKGAGTKWRLSEED